MNKDKAGRHGWTYGIAFIVILMCVCPSSLALILPFTHKEADTKTEGNHWCKALQAKLLSLLWTGFQALQRQRKNKKGTGVAGERKEGVERMGGAEGPFKAEIPSQSPGHTWVPNPVTGRGWGCWGSIPKMKMETINFPWPSRTHLWWESLWGLGGGMGRRREGPPPQLPTLNWSPILPPTRTNHSPTQSKQPNNHWMLNPEA